MLSIIQILSSLGFSLSLYALYVRYKSKSKKYKPLCDIGKNISCTKAFSSEYGKLVVMPNPVYGIMFYSLIFIIDMYYKKYVFSLATLSVFVSIYLSYVSYFKQKNFCLVCTGIYLTNILLFVLSL